MGFLPAGCHFRRQPLYLSQLCFLTEGFNGNNFYRWMKCILEALLGNCLDCFDTSGTIFIRPFCWSVVSQLHSKITHLKSENMVDRCTVCGVFIYLFFLLLLDILSGNYLIRCNYTLLNLVQISVL